MATYLLEAEDERMERWKAAADDRGYSFADFISAALDAHSETPKPERRRGGGQKKPRGRRRPTPPPSPAPPPVASDSGKRSYEPDFKEGPKKR